MRTAASILMQAPGEYEPAEVELDEPRRGELLVRMVSSGLCHSDDHVATGDLPVPVYPFCGGHEGAGVVERVGPDTDGWSPGEHVVLAFIPACGRCRWCASGMQNLCNVGATTITGARFDDPTSYRMQLDGRPVAQFGGIGTLSQFSTVDTRSVVKVPSHIPLARLALLGCGVTTGWGSAVNAAAVTPGDTVVVMGVGGVGMSAIQGARHAGASQVIAVDPVALKRDLALEFGATHVAETMPEAREIARTYTEGQGADSAIVTVGVTTGAHVGEAVEVIRKAGTVVVTGAARLEMTNIPVNLLMLTMMQKRIVGALYGMTSPLETIPRLVALYELGQLRLDEMVTTRYALDDVAQGFRDMKAGTVLRGAVDFG